MANQIPTKVSAFANKLYDMIGGYFEWRMEINTRKYAIVWEGGGGGTLQHLSE